MNRTITKNAMPPFHWPNELRFESTVCLLEKRQARPSLPVEVGRLAEAAGEEKSAKPPMRSELPPGWMDTHHKK